MNSNSLQGRSANAFAIRRATAGDAESLVDIWWRSAQATHSFVERESLEALRADVIALRLELQNTWMLCGSAAQDCGFLVMDENDVAALFIAPEWLRQGGGHLLMHHARSLAGPLTVQVNEQNSAALAFYLAEGFVVVGRSETDSHGRPYPLLHLAERAGNKKIAAEV